MNKSSSLEQRQEYSKQHLICFLETLSLFTPKKASSVPLSNIRKYYDGTCCLSLDQFKEYAPMYNNVQAIYLENKKFARVWVSELFVEGATMSARINLIPTPGLYSAFRVDCWSISLGVDSYYGPGRMGEPYLSLSVFFGWELVEAVVKFCATLPAKYETEHCYAIMDFINKYLEEREVEDPVQLGPDLDAGI